MVYRSSFSNGHQTSSHSSFIPGWLVLLLQVKTRHPQNSVHGILFLQQLHLPSHPHLHPHFIRCSTASGGGGFKHRTGEKWLEHASNVQPNAAGARCWEAWVIFISFPPNHGCVVCMFMYEYVSPVNQKLVEGFLLWLHDLSRGNRTSKALLLLCEFLIDTAYKKRSSWEHASEGR